MTILSRVLQLVPVALSTYDSLTSASKSLKAVIKSKSAKSPKKRAPEVSEKEISCAEVDWEKIQHFTKKELAAAAGDLSRVNARLLFKLDQFRDKLGVPVHLSPMPGAWYRTDGSVTSRHYAVGRMSDAGDVFPEGPILNAFITALHCGFTGIGIYLDTHYNGKKMPMLHLDLRPTDVPVIWLREKDSDGKETYTTFYPKRGADLLREILKKLSEV